MDYYKKYKKYKSLYSNLRGGQLSIDNDDIHPIGSSEDIEGLKRSCFLIKVPPYKSLNGKWKNKLPFYISSGTSKNNVKNRIVPFNGIIISNVGDYYDKDILHLMGLVGDDNTQYENYIQSVLKQNYLSHDEFSRLLNEKEKKNKLAEKGKEFIFKKDPLETIVKKTILSYDTLTNYWNTDGEHKLYSLKTWIMKLNLKDANGNDIPFFSIFKYPDRKDLSKFTKDISSISKIDSIFDIIKQNEKNVLKYIYEKLFPFVDTLNEKFKVIEETYGDNIINVRFLNTETNSTFTKVVPSFNDFFKNNINYYIGCNNLFGIHLYQFRTIVPYLRYLKYLLRLDSNIMTNRKEFLNTTLFTGLLPDGSTGNIKIKHLLMEASYPTPSDILYNIFTCVYNKNRNHWCYSPR